MRQGFSLNGNGQKFEVLYFASYSGLICTCTPRDAGPCNSSKDVESRMYEVTRCYPDEVKSHL